MKTVGFLQNQWFKRMGPDTDARQIRRKAILDTELLLSTPERREQMIAMYLFMGCLTGRRLLRAFGSSLCDDIVWEECSRHYGWESGCKFDPDPKHMLDVLTRHRPAVVVAFGGVARCGLALPEVSSELRRMTVRIIIGPHPAARGGSVGSELRSVHGQLLSAWRDVGGKAAGD
jgi:hypothetical protein